MIRRIMAVALTAGAAAAGIAAGPAAAHPTDGFRVAAGTSLNAQLRLGGTLISHTDPAHGTRTVDPSGRFRYTPAAGFTGTDS
ncbi:MAG TPA: Ig-like domain-containing protein, partial [Mycobacteriales bacterium]|nr:Ig-like domain-containing protein [Mycobacteriales bacterium]